MNIYTIILLRSKFDEIRLKHKEQLLINLFQMYETACSRGNSKVGVGRAVGYSSGRANGFSNFQIRS